MTGEDIEAIIEGRPGPLIDGRPYKSEAFREMAEEYHRRVIEAHKSHSKQALELPRIEAVPIYAGAVAMERDSGNYDSTINESKTSDD